MDTCLEEILIHIGNFLPWKTRLRFEGLAKRFRNLPYQQNQTASLDVHNLQEAISFELTLLEKSKERRIILSVINKNIKPSSDPLFELFSNQRLCKHYMLTTEYIEFSIYMIEKLMFLFTIQNYSFRYAKNEFCTRLTKLFNEKSRFLPEKLGISVTMRGSPTAEGENEFSVKDWEFLESLKGLHSFAMYGPYRLTKKDLERFCKLPYIQTAKVVELFFSLQYQIYFILECEINNDFVQSLIDREAERFVTNTVCSVTPLFLLKYIKNCLSGSHALSFLSLQIPDSSIVGQGLSTLGFTEERSRRSRRTTTLSLSGKRVVDCREKKEGQKPDELIVKIHGETIWIQADYAEYRTTS